MLKANQGTFKIKNLNREIKIESLVEKELFLSKLEISCYPEPDQSSIRLN